MSILKELWAFLKVRKKFWLFPIILVMLFLGALIVLAQGSAVAPFIYTIFQCVLVLSDFEKSNKTKEKWFNFYTKSSKESLFSILNKGV